MLKFLREGAKRLGAATTPGAKRGGTKKGGGSKYYKRDKDTGQVKSLSEKKLTRRGAGVAAAGAATGVTGAAAASKGDKPKAKAKTSRRGPSMKEAGANIKKSKEAFERRRRSNRQAESAMKSVQKSRALGEAAARDPKATKPTPPKAPPTTSVKPPKASPKVTSGATKPTPPKATTTPKVASPPKVTKRPTVTGGGTTMASRNVTREGPMGKRTLANVTREQLTASGLSLNNAGLRTYLEKFDELGRRPKPSDFKKTKEKASKKRTTSRVGSPASGANRRPKPAGKSMGGMMKPKGMRRGGRVMAEPEMPTPPRRRRRGTPRPPLNPKVLRPPVNPNLTPAPGRRTKTPTSTPTLDVLAPRRGKRPTKTPTPNVDGATRRRGKTPNRPPMPKLPGGMKGGGMASKMSAKGGARGGKKMMMPGGMKAGGSASKFPDMTGDGRVTQKDILKARGVPGFSKGDLVINMVRELSKLGRRAFEKEYGKAALNKAIKDTNKASGLTPTKAKKTPTQKKLAEADRRAEETKYTRQTPAAKKQRQVRASEKRMERMKNGGMAKKGYAKGGMAKKGYSKGGAVSRKPRGVGAAKRGYGKAMR